MPVLGTAPMTVEGITALLSSALAAFGMEPDITPLDDFTLATGDLHVSFSETGVVLHNSDGVRLALMDATLPYAAAIAVVEHRLRNPVITVEASSAVVSTAQN